MRFPFLWMAGALAGGVLLRGGGERLSLPLLPLAAFLLLAGLLLARAQQLRLAWCAGLAAWCALGAAAANLQQAAIPENHVTQLFARGALNSEDTLRWRGQLRTEPQRTPWGLRYELELENVDVAGLTQNIVGGLRVNYFASAEQNEPAPRLRAGDRVVALLRARPPRNFLTPGAFDARGQLARQGIHLSGSLRSLELLRKLDSPNPTWHQRAARLRGELLQRIATLFAGHPEHAAVLRAILLGDHTFVEQDLAENFQKTAAYHVLVVSGLHVAALAAFVFWVARRMRLPHSLAVLLSLGALLFFVALVENRPPIARAAWIGAIALAATLLFRKAPLLNSVGAAVLVMLAAQPDSLFDSSFQLSFLAGAMIGAIGLPLLERISTPWRDALAHISDVTRDSAHAPRLAQFRLDLRALADWAAARAPQRLRASVNPMLTLPLRAGLRLWDVFLISAVIQTGMLPVLAHYFHRVSLAGPIANIPAAILAALLIPIGLATLAISWVSSALASVLAAATSLLTEALLRSVGWFAGWSAVSYRIPGSPAWLAALFFAALMGTAWLLNNEVFPRRKIFAVTSAIVMLTAGVTIAVYPFAPQLTAGDLAVTVLDVGQGDAIFVAFPGGQTMLLDGGGQFGPARATNLRSGPDVGENVVSPYLWSRGLQRIDVVALSHAHQDHLEGLLAVLDNFQVGELWVGREIRSPAFAALLQKAIAHGVRVVHLRRGDAFHFGAASGMVLWPEDSPPADTASNNDSFVLRIDYGARSFLLAGDIEAQVESELFTRDDPLGADFLKVPHHGSRTSTTTDFALAVRPQVAVMSLSETNPFGHPHPQVLATLRALGAVAYRTDQDGAVTVSTDGQTLRAQPYKKQD